MLIGETEWVCAGGNGNFVLSGHFFCNPKTILKCKVYSLFLNIAVIHKDEDGQ